MHTCCQGGLRLLQPAIVPMMTYLNWLVWVGGVTLTYEGNATACGWGLHAETKHERGSTQTAHHRLTVGSCRTAQTLEDWQQLSITEFPLTA
jgi:hypothetical protein